MKYLHFSLYNWCFARQTFIQSGIQSGIQANTQADIPAALRARSLARLSSCSRVVARTCALACILACILTWTLTYSPMAHAQVTITSSQAREADKAKAPRFTPSQMGLRKETAHSQTVTTPTNQPHPATSATASEAEAEAETRNLGPAGANSPGPNTAEPHFAETETTGEHSGSENQGDLSAEEIAPTPPNWSTAGANAVITITPSTALKSASQHSLGEGEGEEKSATSWSSNATKAIIQYQEPAEPKPATGAPQLRPLN